MPALLLIFLTFLAVSLMPAQAAAGGDKIHIYSQPTLEMQQNYKGVPSEKLDQDGDGNVSREEIAPRLFESFDGDNNGLIDYQEWRHRKIITLVPSEREKVIYLDRDGDGQNDDTVYRREEFMRKTVLSPFDEGGDGLTAEEFCPVSFKKADIDDSDSISLNEWIRTFGHTKPIHFGSHNYN